MNGIICNLPMLVTFESNEWLSPAFIGAVIIVAVFALMGLKRGLIKTVFDLAGMLVALILTVLITPTVASLIRKSAGIFNLIHSKIEQHVHINFNSSGNELSSYLDGLSMPEKIQQFLLEGNGAISNVANNSVEQLNRGIVDKLTDIAINCIAFMITYVIMIVLIKIVSMVLDLVSKLPVINFTNKMLGLGIGLIEAYIVLSIIGVLVMAFPTSKIGITLSVQISSNPILSFIYKHNLILMGITKLKGMLN